MCLNSYFLNSPYLNVYVSGCFIFCIILYVFNVDNQFPNNIHLFLK